MASNTDIDTGNLFLTDVDRKPVKPSELAQRSIAKAPPNLAIYKDDDLHPVVSHVLNLARQAQSGYMNNWQPMKDKWDKADEFYWMAQKDFRLQDLTRAIVSASVYYRTCRRLADGAYIATFKEDMPVKFFPDIGVFEASEDKDKKAIVSEALNRWASYCMRKTKMEEKARQAYYQVYKYGNLICSVPYDYKIEKRKKWETVDVNEIQAGPDGVPIYVHSDTGEVSSQPHPAEMHEVEYDYVCHDEVGFHVLPISSCFLDNRIKELDRQTVFIWRTDITRPEIWAEAKAGKFQNVDKITELQRFQQYSWENSSEYQRIVDAGKTTSDSYNSEVYERWQCWMLLPKIKVKTGKNGKVTDLEWDQNGESRRYVLEMVGSLTGNPVIVNFRESPYWGNGIPFIDAHSHDDDSGFWTRGLEELLEDNMFQERVTKGQLMDNRTLLNFRPIVRLQGRVKNKDMRITHNTVFDVTSPDAISQLQVTDLTGNINNTLQYLEQDSEKTAQTPPFMLGEALGSRTSATEFSAVRDQSSAPALNDIKKLNMQIFGAYMRKLKEYAPQFLDHDVVVPRGTGGERGEQAVALVSADEFNADMIVKEVAVQEFENEATMRQILLNLINVVSNPTFAPFINIPGFLERVFKTFSTVFPNPEEIMNKDPEVMALLQQYLSQKPGEGQAPNPQLPGGGMPPPMPEGQMMAGVMGQAGGA